MTAPTSRKADPRLQRLARDAYVARQLLARRTVLATRRLWAELDPDRIRLSWVAAVGPKVLQALTAAQETAAAAADPTIEQLLTAQGVTAAAASVIRPSAFAGTASDGRDLASLLELSNLVTLTQIRAGVKVQTALQLGGAWLERTVGLQVVDAGRTSDGVAIAVRRSTGGYVRMLSPPSCNRCVVLAGKFYRWNSGFLRHPKCDCRHIPTSEDAAGDLRTDPQAYFDSLSQAEQDATFGRAGAAAIRDGADIGQVVNARRGMYTAAGGRRFTTAGIAHRHGGVRLVPEQIYREARGDRDEAIRLLRRFGYLT